MTLKDNDELAFDVEFMTCVIDKAADLKVVDSDSHFSDFVGVHPSKIKQGKISLLDVLKPKERESVMRQLCKKDARYVYTSFYIKNKADEYVFVHCTGQNIDNSSQCRLTLADVSRSIEKTQELQERANEMNHLIDLVTGGVCLFKVTQNMHIKAIYLNQSCCKMFGTVKGGYDGKDYRIDELIHPDDKSAVYQSIGASMAAQKPVDMEFRVQQHSTTWIWCKCNANIQRYDDDNCPVFHAVFTDITKVKNAEREADRQSEKMTKLFKSLPGPIFCTYLDNPFVMDVVSSDFLKLLGYSRSEFFERYDGDLSNFMVDEEVNLSTTALNNQAKENVVIYATYSIKTKSGKTITVRDRRKVVELDEGRKTTIGILRDVTEK